MKKNLIYFGVFILCVVVVSISYKFYFHRLNVEDQDGVTHEWLKISEGVDYQKHEYDISSRKGILDIYKIDGSKFRPELEYDQNAKKLKDWKTGKDELILNGCFFEKDYSPSGYFVLDSETLKAESFDPKYSGMILIRNSVLSITDSPISKVNEEKPIDYALQSFPMLINDNEIADVSISQNQARRTAIGIDHDKLIFIIISDNGNLSLENFAKVLQSLNMNFDKVLNLDGGPSTGIYVKIGEYTKIIDSKWEIPNVIRFEKI